MSRTKKVRNSKTEKTKGSRRGKRLASPDAPKFDPKKHITLSELAKRCNISYQSMYLRQRRSNIKAIATNHNGVEIIAFLRSDAKKIEDNNPKKMRADNVTFSEIEQEFDISRPKLMNVLLRLKIAPVKRQAEKNRQTLTVTKSQYGRIKKELNA
jgi:hypothetical protein